MHSPVAPAVKVRQRHRISTGESRVEKAKRLVAELRLREMTRPEIATYLSLSSSGARKYIVDMSEAGVIEKTGTIPCKGQHFGVPTYGLVDSPEALDFFLESLDTGKMHSSPVFKTARSPLEIAQQNPARHFHLLSDDCQFNVRVNNRAPARDPEALPPEFFKREQCA